MTGPASQLQDPPEATAAAVSPECPRCGYDLSGLAGASKGKEPRRHERREEEGTQKSGLATEEPSAKVNGVCSECGLEFEWRLVYQPWFAGWAWFIETAERRLTRACVFTTLRVLVPWRFWNDVRMESPVRAARIALWAGTMSVVLGTMLGAVFVAQCVAEGFHKSRTIVYGTPTQVGSNRFVTPIGLTPVTMNRVSLVPMVEFAKFEWQRTWTRRRAGYREAPQALCWAVGASLMAPLVVLALPHTRARAKVRRLHILRAAAYCLAWIVPFCLWGVGVRLVELGIGMVNIFRTPPPGMYWGFGSVNLSAASMMHGNFAIFAGVLLGVWLFMYWGFVLVRGWRMRAPDAMPAIVSIGLCSILAGFAFAFWAGEFMN